MDIKNTPVDEQVEEMGLVGDVSRRRFFQMAGGIAGAGLLLAACKKRTPSPNVYLGAGDVALLNLYYVIQQLEAAFYTQAVATPYYGLTVSESQLLTDMRDQEIAHCEFMKRILGKDAVADVSLNFSAVTFADRTSTLTYGAKLEDLAVSCLNGSAPLYKDLQFVYELSKMASVEARHAAYFRDLLRHNTFADSSVVDVYGLDLAATPQLVLEDAYKFLHTRYDASKLPG